MGGDTIKKLKKGQFQKILVAGICLSTLVFTAATLYVFLKTGAEPSTLITCFFTWCGVEGGFNAWLKTCDRKSTKKEEELK